MKKILRLSCALVILVSFFSSCTVEKRKYQSGYNIQWKNSKPHATVRESVQINRPVADDAKAAVSHRAPENIIYDEPIIASADHSTAGAFVILEKSVQHANLLPEECDVILLKTGEEIKAKVSEITQSEIKYKKCDDVNGATYTLKKSEVFMIKYPNGTKDVIAQDTPAETKKAPAEKEDSGLLGILSFAALMGSILCSIIGAGVVALLLWPTAIVLAILGLGKGRKQKGFAIATLVIIGLSLILLIIALAAFSGWN